MELTFDLGALKPLIEHTLAAPGQRSSYGGDVPFPALLIVGDQGVYIMSNGRPALVREDNPERSKVVYANECNPDTMGFDTWWAAKQASWGGDDGSELLQAQFIADAMKKQPQATKLVIALSETQVDISLR